MINKISLLTLITAILFFSSCVSKKKFLEMQEGRVQAEQQVSALTSENQAKDERINTMISDFEAMKNELLQSNAEKDQYIDKLNRELVSLTDQLDSQKESLQSNSFTYSFEKDRLNESLEARDKTIKALESRIKTLEQEISMQSTELSDRNIRMNSLIDQMDAGQAERERISKHSGDLQLQIQKHRAEIDSLKQLIVEKDENISRLQNNVNLLKKQVGGGN